MTNPRKQDFVDDRADQSSSDDFSDLSSTDLSSVSSGSLENGVSRNEDGFANRLTNILIDNDDGESLVSDGGRENNILHWLHALDVQVMGACRGDERLKPLLKSNGSTSVAEEGLLAQLSQHFEPGEVGMLARCFCLPLVSLRVGKTNKEGTRLCPTDARGNLILMVLPTSDLRLSFIGDNGQTERLFTFSSKSQCSAMVIEEIIADTSSRSFLLKVPDGRVFYYWCSEKSKLLGTELLLKMKDFIKRKPSIAELTGISESRLSCFATNVRVYLLGSAAAKSEEASYGGSSTPYLDSPSDCHNTSEDEQYVSEPQQCQAIDANLFSQSSRSSSSISLKEDIHTTIPLQQINLSPIENLSVTSTDTFRSIHIENELDFLKLQRNFALPPISVSGSNPAMFPPPFSPYYSWCPLGASSAPPRSISSLELPKLPPFACLLPVSGSSPPNLTDIPPLNFPTLLPDPFTCLPSPNPEQIPTFTPLMCDPIVHIPFVDYCSAGQAYLVSGVPTISTSINPLHSRLMNPLLTENDSVAEKGARETLRFLISGSTQPNLFSVDDDLPSVLTKVEGKQSIFVTGSHGLFSGNRDFDTAMGFVAVGGPSANIKRRTRNNDEDVSTQQEGASGMGKSCTDSEGSTTSQISNAKEEKTD